MMLPIIDMLMFIFFTTTMTTTTKTAKIMLMAQEGKVIAVSCCLNSPLHGLERIGRSLAYCLQSLSEVVQTLVGGKGGQITDNLRHAFSIMNILYQ